MRGKTFKQLERVRLKIRKKVRKDVGMWRKLRDDEIENAVKRWHLSKSKMSLAEYLGMTHKAYARWVEAGIPKGEKNPCS